VYPNLAEQLIVRDVNQLWVADRRLDVYELRCTKCGKTRWVTRGESLPIDTGEDVLGRRPKLPR
jgi:hypothetical protein